MIEICKHCKGTGKVDVFDPASGTYIKGLICQCKCDLKNTEEDQNKQLSATRS